MKRKLTGGGAWCESGRRPATAAGGRRAEGGREGVKLISDRDRGPTEIIVVVRFSWKKKKLLSGQAQGDGRPSGVAGGARRHAVTWLPTLPTRGWPGRGGYRTFHLPGLAQEPAPAPAVPRLSPARPAASPPVWWKEKRRRVDRPFPRSSSFGSINCSDAQFSVQHLCTLPLDSLGQKFILTTMLLL
ncbi:hypothetical protein PVAP13_9NG136500 [Panicum virgatum]|uniref:Uncharacterized protein n=1 Tax=Panicum virgatum TaxID=38727 RepID=A0A8T0MEI3_PANVG|nr:hypothetical protein PVAP13_9NG136500 [Panicum virgatum]